MDILKLLCVAIGSFLALFLLTRLNGKRQVSELSAFDYINGITIGSIAAEMATELEEFWKPLIAMAVYALLTLLFAWLSDKSVIFRHMTVGCPQILLEDGVFYRKNFKSGHIDLDEFLSRCRAAGYFKITDIQLAILEPNGTITFLPYDQARPATPADLNMAPKAEKPPVTVVSDGCMLKPHLRAAGLTEQSLREKLSLQGVQSLREVFLATCDDEGALRVYPVQPQAPRSAF